MQLSLIMLSLFQIIQYIYIDIFQTLRILPIRTARLHLFSVFVLKWYKRNAM